MNIHPTAIIEEGAALGPEVEVGPHALIGSGVTLGAGCRVRANAAVVGRVTLGERNVVGFGVVIGGAAPEAPGGGEVRIGHGNVFREYSAIAAGADADSATTVGDGNFLMVGAHVGADCRVGDRVVIVNNCLLMGRVMVGDRAVLGGGTVFKHGVRVGRLAMVSGGAFFERDIPPFVVADEDNCIGGLNAIGLRRAGFSSETRLELKRLFRLVFRLGRTRAEALVEIEALPWGVEAREIIAFLRAPHELPLCAARPCRAEAAGAESLI